MVQRGGGAVQGDQETLQEWRGRGAEAERGETVSPIVGWGVWVLCGRGGRARQPFGDHAQQGHSGAQCRHSDFAHHPGGSKGVALCQEMGAETSMYFS